MQLTGRSLMAASCRNAAFALVGAILALPGCGQSSNEQSSRVNGSVHIRAGKAPAVAETVNGSVEIDANATVTAAETVNGGIRLGAHSTADSVTTVNGSVVADAGARIAGRIESVNGGITLRDGTDVAGPIENVNGNIELRTAHVAGRIKTVNGSINIQGDSRVEGGILVEKPERGWIHFLANDVPRIVIGPGATVSGELRFERQVQLYVSNRATIGTVIGATAIPFAGDSPAS